MQVAPCSRAQAMISDDARGKPRLRFGWGLSRRQNGHMAVPCALRAYPTGVL